jgi:transcriptional regulator with PAS, ATPase and Fis domain
VLREHGAGRGGVIGAALRKAAGNKSEAARMLGISYPSLLQKIKHYGGKLDISA